MEKFLETLKWLVLDARSDGMLKRYLRNALFLCPVASLVLTLIFGGTTRFLPRFGFGLLVSVTVSGVCHAFAFLARAAGRQLALWKGMPPPERGKGWSFLVSASAMVPGLYLGFRVAEAVFNHFGHHFHVHHFEDYGSGVLIGTLILGAVILAEMHRDSQGAEKAAKLRVSQLEKESLQAQLSALTAQMNPHLLFNALNTIASLIPAEPEKAEEMTVRLAELYRGVLTSARQTKHSLATELGICRNYLAVEKARYGERLEVDFQLTDTVDLNLFEIPVLTLQPLVENAIRHGIAPRASGGKLALSVLSEGAGVRLLVEDDGVGYGNSSARPGAGTGIANCRERLRLHYGDAGQLRIEAVPGGGTRVQIEIPGASC